jgi:hypothetical protein
MPTFPTTKAEQDSPWHARVVGEIIDQTLQRNLVVRRPQLEGQVDSRGGRAHYFLDSDELLIVRLADPSRERRATWEMIFYTEVAAYESQQPTEVVGLLSWKGMLSAMTHSRSRARHLLRSK